MTELLWLRRDLRIRDNPLFVADVSGVSGPVVAFFVLDDELLQRVGAARRGYLHASLVALDQEIRRRGGPGLVIARGPADEVVLSVATAVGATRVFAAEEFSPYARARDAKVASALGRVGISLEFQSGPYLHQPGAVRKESGDRYSVFTPYFREWSRRPIPSAVEVGDIDWATGVHGTGVPDLNTGGNPGAEIIVGEVAALKTLQGFVARGANKYATQASRPDLVGTSRLSAALHFGEIHPRTILQQVRGNTTHRESNIDTAAFVRQVAWRDFYADVLDRIPHAVNQNVDARFDRLEWETGPDADSHFAAWCAGETGYPFVDAGMRQLRQENWMHNRLRMVVASFLTKDLLLPWQRGAEWFMEHLVDADVANNSLGWQWAAGTGMDAAPFHRVFNPVLQGKRFDPDGDYVRRYVPELRHIGGAQVHEPWFLLDGYSHGYVPQVVDHKESREIALAAYAAVRVVQ